MLRVFGNKLVNSGNCKSILQCVTSGGSSCRQLSHDKEETAEEFNQRFVNFFNNTEIDGWFIRKGLGELQREDVIPEPEIICAVLKACRRVNDLALAIRCLEAMRLKCGTKKATIWPYLMQECKSTMDELGVPTLEEIGYNEPEFHKPDPNGWWPLEYNKLYNVRRREVHFDKNAHYY